MEEKSNVWIGIDIGTTSVKVSVIGPGGSELISQSQNTDAEISNNTVNAGNEQCPNVILNTIEKVTLPILDRYKNEIKGIGICGQMHGIVLWKKVEKGKLCGSQHTAGDTVNSLADIASCYHKPSHLYTWQDQRCTPNFLATLPTPSNPNLPISTGHGFATLFWLAEFDSATLDQGQYDCCGTIVDFLVWLLCGLDHPITSDQLAASLGYFNQKLMGWDPEILDHPKFPNHILPSVVQSGTQVGVVRPSLTTWHPGVPVLVGMGDVQCAMGAVLRSPSQAAINISTSIQLGFLVPSDDTKDYLTSCPPSISFFPFSDTHQLALFAGLNGGNALTHFVECISSWMKDLGCNADACSISNIFTKLSTLACQDEERGNPNPTTNSDILNVRPSFYGERHNPNLTAFISNITLTNFKNVGFIFRSLCEGLILHLGSMVPASFLAEQEVKELVVCGSVAVKNLHVRNALIKVYSQEGLAVSFDQSEGNAVSSAVGAARFARSALPN